MLQWFQYGNQFRANNLRAPLDFYPDWAYIDGEPIPMTNPKRAYPTLKHWRDALGLNQCGAAARLGICQPYYSRLERQKQYPRRQLAKAIADHTHVPLETVLGVA